MMLFLSMFFFFLVCEALACVCVTMLCFSVCVNKKNTMSETEKSTQDKESQNVKCTVWKAGGLRHRHLTNDLLQWETEK